MALRTRFIILLILVLVVPMLLSQAYLLQRIFAIQEKTYRTHLHTLANEVYEDLKIEKEQAIFSSNLIAQSNSLNIYLDNERYQLPEATAHKLLLKDFANHLRSHDSFRTIYFLLPDGQVDVQFDLLGNLPTHEQLPDKEQFANFLKQNKSSFTWYSTQQEPGHLRLLVAHAVYDTGITSITRHQARQVRGYVIISVTLEKLKYFGTDYVAHKSGVVSSLLLLRHQGKAWLKSPSFSRELFLTNRIAADAQLPTRTLNGETYLLEYDNHEPGISIEVWLPQSQLYHDSSLALLQNLFISILEITFVSLLFYIVLNRWLITPLQNAQRLTRQLRDGQWLKRQASAAKNRSPNDEVQQLVAAMYDMSETLEKTSVELERKRGQAEEAERLKTEFLANISHEIRTPVNIIVGIMARLEKTIEETRQKEAMSLAKNEALRLVKSIDELILLADIETRKQHIVRREFYLPDLLQRCVAIAQPLAIEKGLKFTTDIDAGSHRLLLGDTQMITKIFDILLGNAIKFTDHGEITLYVRCSSNDVDTRLDVIVSDTGPGIAPEAMPTLGEAFRQLDGSLNREHGGLGIGLAICKGILALHNSTLEVASTPGQGSQFSFTLVLPTFTTESSR